MSKSRDAFRTISEVAELLETPAHVLRFWETKFTQVKPVKRAGGRRYYRPNDVALLAGIRQLLHDDGLTIKGVQKVLREQGVKHVAAIAPPPGLLDDADEAPAAAPLPQDAEAPAETATVLPFAQPQVAQPQAPSEDAPAPEVADAPASDTAEPVAAQSPQEAEPFPESEDPAPQPAAPERPWAPDPQAAPATGHLASGDDALPDFLTHSLEDRAGTPEADAEDPASAPAAQLPVPDVAQPEIAQPEIAQPEITQPDIALPEIAQPDQLPRPAPGPLSALAALSQLSPAQAASARAQLAALRAFVAAREGQSAV